jgi:O-antigen ligase/polysaccharide polymerase Wzy-like membrane protein
VSSSPVGLPPGPPARAPSSRAPARPPKVVSRRPALITAFTRGHGAELALLGILVAKASIGFEGRLPVLPLGVNLELPDALLVGALAYIALRRALTPNARLVRTPVDVPMLAFTGVTLFATLLAVVRSSVSIYDAIDATRTFSYYLTFFVVTNLLTERRQLEFLVKGMFVIATLVACAMVAQYVFGDVVHLLQSSDAADDITFGAIVRIDPPGFSLVLVSLLTICCILICEKFKPAVLLQLLQCGVLGMALVLTYFRSYWTAVILVLPLGAYLVRGHDRRRLLGWVSLILVPTTLLLIVVVTVPDWAVSRLLKGSWDRLSTVGSSGTFTGSDPNYDYRRIENGYAFAAIREQPLLGRGLGASFRPLDPRLDWRDEKGLHDLSNHLHNAHLGVVVQSGLLGYACLVWLSVVVVRRGLSGWRTVPNDRMRAIVLGFTLVYLTLLIAAGANSLFVLSYWTPVIGIIIGVNEAVLRKVRPA